MADLQHFASGRPSLGGHAPLTPPHPDPSGWRHDARHVARPWSEHAMATGDGVEARDPSSSAAGASVQRASRQP
jgi:hypothetical protein